MTTLLLKLTKDHAIMLHFNQHMTYLFSHYKVYGFLPTLNVKPCNLHGRWPQLYIDTQRNTRARAKNTYTYKVPPTRNRTILLKVETREGKQDWEGRRYNQTEPYHSNLLEKV